MQFLIEEFQTNYHQIKRKLNSAADSLSRISIANSIVTDLVAFPLDYRYLAQEQHRDSLCRRIIRLIQNPDLPRTPKETRTLAHYKVQTFDKHQLLIRGADST